MFEISKKKLSNFHSTLNDLIELIVRIYLYISLDISISRVMREENFASHKPQTCIYWGFCFSFLYRKHNLHGMHCGCCLWAKNDEWKRVMNSARNKISKTQPKLQTVCWELGLDFSSLTFKFQNWNEIIIYILACKER
jgi:hypothetical protein